MRTVLTPKVRRLVALLTLAQTTKEATKLSATSTKKDRRHKKTSTRTSNLQTIVCHARAAQPNQMTKSGTWWASATSRPLKSKRAEASAYRLKHILLARSLILTWDQGRSRPLLLYQGQQARMPLHQPLNLKVHLRTWPAKVSHHHWPAIKRRHLSQREMCRMVLVCRISADDDIFLNEKFDNLDEKTSFKFTN